MLESFLFITISIFFPISIYLNYLTYITNLEIKEKSIFLEFILIVILILTIRFLPTPSLANFLLCNIPILLCIFLKKRKNYFELVTIFLILIFSKKPIVFIFFLLKYILYFFIFFSKNISKREIYIIFIIVEIASFILIPTISYKYLFVLVLNLFLTICYSYLAYLLLYTGDKVIDYSKVLQELEHEKLLRTSISKLTHELKNPIAVCQGYLEMLDLKNKDKAAKYINIISDEIIRSKTIIDDFSSYGKLKKLDIDELDLNLLLEDVQNLLSPLFNKSKAKLIIDSKEEVYIFGDYNKLKQVLVNLLKNTIEAQKEDTQLITKVVLKETPHKIKLIISDNGIGMSKEILERVSEVFFTTKSMGTGIGLAYSKEVIELHHGELKIKSILNEGTDITIILPKEKKSEDFNNKNY